MTDRGVGARRSVVKSVALLTELFYPSVGGQQTRFQALAHGLRDQGFQVTVVTTMHARHLLPEEYVDGVRILRGPFLPKYLSPAFSQTVRSPIGMFRFGIRCRTVLRREKFDFVYFNQWPYLHIYLAPKSTRRCSGIDWCEARDSFIHRWPERQLPRMVAVNLSVNQWTGSILTARSGVSVGYLPSGVDLKRFSRVDDSTDRRGLLFLGRLVSNKNLPLLISGYVRYRERGGTEMLFIAGSGPEIGLLQSLVNVVDAGIRSSICILGEVSEKEKIELLERSSLLAMPSTREGFPNVVVEAIASGTPTVTVNSRENGTAHVVKQYGIGTVGEPTPDGFAEAIEVALMSWSALHERCSEVSGQFDWSVVTKSFSATMLSAIVTRGAN